jgi:hypothetical protein
MEAIGSLAALRFIALAGAEAACGISWQAGATSTRSKRSGGEAGTNGGNAARANEYRSCSIQSCEVIEHRLPPLDSWRSGERKEGMAIDLTFERQESYTGRTCP